MTLEEAIKDMDARWAETFNRGDTSALIGLHSDDFLLLPPNSPAQKGAAAGISGFQELLDAGWKNISFNTVQFHSDGDLGYHVGQYSADVPAEDGSTAKETGKYIDIYKRLPNGTWKICVTMFNSDAA
jgi:ketosteroid isomerase-like protein